MTSFTDTAAEVTSGKSRDTIKWYDWTERCCMGGWMDGWFHGGKYVGIVTDQ